MLVDAREVKVEDGRLATVGHHRVAVLDHSLEQTGGVRLPRVAHKAGRRPAVFPVLKVHVRLLSRREPPRRWLDNLCRYVPRLFDPAGRVRGAVEPEHLRLQRFHAGERDADTILCFDARTALCLKVHGFPAGRTHR